MRVTALAALLLLIAAPACAEHPAVEAASANLWVKRTPQRTDPPDMAWKDRRGRAVMARNKAAGVPGMNVTVQFPPDSAELDEAQQLALHMLTREWRADPKVQLLWIRTGADPLARKRAEELRRALAGKGFPWERIFLDPSPLPCEAEECGSANRQGVVTVVEAR